MPTAATQLPEFLPPELSHRWTREECAEMERMGLLDLERFELINGQLVRKMSKSALDGALLALFNTWLREIFGQHHVMQAVAVDPSPELIRLNEPEPDVVVVRRPARAFLHARPAPADIALVVEVAVTSLAYDLGAKAALYAASGIEDYWVLDAQGRRTIVHRQPVGSQYTSITAYAAEEAVAPLAAPEAMFRVADLL